jgi:hypothetical protein
MNALLQMKLGQLRIEYQLYSASPHRCAVCHIPAEQLPGNRYLTELQLAHIVPRSHSSQANCVENVLMLCCCCHDGQHRGSFHFNDQLWPSLDMGVLVRAKTELGELNTAVLAALDGRRPAYFAELAKTPLPQKIWIERTRWGPSHYLLPYTLPKGW